jgi:hypothetical protein
VNRNNFWALTPEKQKKFKLPYTVRNNFHQVNVMENINRPIYLDTQEVAERTKGEFLLMTDKQKAQHGHVGHNISRIKELLVNHNSSLRINTTLPIETVINSV